MKRQYYSQINQNLQKVLFFPAFPLFKMSATFTREPANLKMNQDHCQYREMHGYVYMCNDILNKINII